MPTSTPSNTLLLGIDGGGSKTLALLGNTAGDILGRGTAGSSNYQNIGAEAAWAALEQATIGAFTDAGRSLAPLSTICLGLAGVDRPEDRALFEGWAAERFVGAAVVIANDAELVLAAGTPDGWGVALISGTGSIVFGRSPDGHMTRAGGWGHILGDEGSGYAIGLAALRAVMRAFDGRAPQTALTSTILRQWALAQATDLVGRVYRETLSPTDVAALAVLVEEAAAAGDEVARGIVREAGQELALAANAVVRKLGLRGAVPCALAGGVLVRGRGVRAALQAAGREMGLSLEPITPVSEPAQGAVRLARAQLEKQGLVGSLRRTS